MRAGKVTQADPGDLTAREPFIASAKNQPKEILTEYAGYWMAMAVLVGAVFVIAFVVLFKSN